MPDDNTNQNIVGNALDKEIAAFEGVHAVNSIIKSNESKESQQSRTTDKTDQQSDKSIDKTEGTTKTEVDKSVLSAAKQGTEKSEPKKDEIDIKAFEKILNPDKSFIKAKTDEKVIKPDDGQTDKDKIEDKGKPERNLEGFGEQEKVWLKRMPYEAYEYFSKALKEKRTIEDNLKTKEETYTKKIKELEVGKQILPESYYENENAFVLSPEFNNLQTYVQTAKAVENHWSEQLNLFKQGKNWTTLINDPKTGELVLGEEREYDAADEVYLLRQLNGASQQTSQWQGEATKFISGYKEKHQDYINTIKANQEKMLPVFKDKESIEYKTYEAIKPQVEKWGINKNNPAFDFLAQAVALNLVFRDALTSLLASQQKTNDIKEEQKQAGPTMNNLSGGSSSNINNRNKEISIADFDRIISPGKITI